ncbi:hypothetical protein WDZ92_53940 [Nostoc sp. NIES-2111]
MAGTDACERGDGVQSLRLHAHADGAGHDDMMRWKDSRVASGDDHILAYCAEAEAVHLIESVSPSQRQQRPP